MAGFFGLAGEFLAPGRGPRKLARNIDLFVLPSVNEALSYALMEVMAYGRPVIAANSGGIPELIEHNKTGMLIPPEKPSRLAGAIIDLLKDPFKAEILARGARKFIEKKFTITGMVKSFEALYLKAAAERL